MDSIANNVTIGNLQCLIDNYEFLISDLSREIKIFQVEYSDLNSKIKSVVEENEKLSNTITFLIQRQQDNEDYDTKVVDNLKKQLTLISSEKDYTIQLWQNALTTIDQLEKELRVYEEGKKHYVSLSDVNKLKKECNSKIKELEDELDVAKTELIRGTIFEKKDQCLTKQETKIIQNLEEEILALQERLKQSNKIKDESTKTIEKQNKKIKSLENKNKEFIGKVNEAVQVVEEACVEKNLALIREKEAKDEMKRLSQNFLEVIQNAEAKLKTEVDQVKSEFNSNLKTVLDDLKKAHSDSVVKQTEIETYAKQCTLLENEIERLQSRKNANSEDPDANIKLLCLEKNLEKTFQKLLTSERQNIILNAEMSRLKSDMKDMINNFETDLKKREIEKTSLINKIDMMKNDMKDSDKKYFDLMKELETMKTKLLEMKVKFKEQMENQQNELQISHSEELEGVRKKNEKRLRELKLQLEAQVELNQKWRTETRSIVDRFEAQIRKQSDSLKRLAQINFNMKKKIKLKEKDNKKKESRKDLTVLIDPTQIEAKIKSKKI